jgi:glycerol-3-phosphate responsive antiterminator
MLSNAFIFIISIDIFNVAKNVLKEEIINWGFIEDKDDYWRALSSCNVVVSTAKHEFFGVAM